MPTPPTGQDRSANLGIRLGEFGRLGDALKAAEKVEGLWRGLAQKQPIPTPQTGRDRSVISQKPDLPQANSTLLLNTAKEAVMRLPSWPAVTLTHTTLGSASLIALAPNPI